MRRSVGKATRTHVARGNEHGDGGPEVPVPGLTLIGTLRYASLANHDGHQQSRVFITRFIVFDLAAAKPSSKDNKFCLSDSFDFLLLFRLRLVTRTESLSVLLFTISAPIGLRSIAPRSVVDEFVANPIVANVDAITLNKIGLLLWFEFSTACNCF